MPITPSEAKADASVVFVGTVTERVAPLDEGSPDPVTYVFSVEGVEKGVASETFQVRTNNGSAACGVDFRVGGRYEVFALDADGTPFATQCGGTHELPTAAAIEEDPRMPVEGVIAALGIIAVLVLAIVLVSRSRHRD